MTAYAFAPDQTPIQSFGRVVTVRGMMKDLISSLATTQALAGRGEVGQDVSMGVKFSGSSWVYVITP